MGLVGLVSASAGATTITFNSVAPAELTFAIDSGFLFTFGDHAHFDLAGTGPTYAQGDGSQMLWMHHFTNVMTRVGGGTFNLTGLDGGEFYTTAASESQNSTTLRVVGTYEDLSTTTQDFAIDLFADGTPGAPNDMQTFAFNATFVGLTQVEFQGL